MAEIRVQGSVPTLTPQQFVLEFSREFTARLQARTPVATGTLRDSYTVTNVSDTGFELNTNQAYFDFVENGTAQQSPQYMLRATVEESQQITAQLQDTLVRKGSR